MKLFREAELKKNRSRGDVSDAETYQIWMDKIRHLMENSFHRVAPKYIVLKIGIKMFKVLREKKREGVPFQLKDSAYLSLVSAFAMQEVIK
jgi:hypothetical protein